MNRIKKHACRTLTGLAAILLALCLAVSGCAPASNEPVPALTATTSPTPQESAALYQPGTYSATAPGNNGDISISVTFTENTIKTITVDQSTETSGLAT